MEKKNSSSGRKIIRQLIATKLYELLFHFPLELENNSVYSPYEKPAVINQDWTFGSPLIASSKVSVGKFHLKHWYR